MKSLLYILPILAVLLVSCDGIENTQYMVQKLQFDSLQFATADEAKTVDTLNWIGNDLSGSFTVEDIIFHNKSINDSTYTGFAYTRNTNVTDKDSLNLTSKIGAGAFETTVYAVANLSEECVIEVDSEETRIFENLHVVPSFYTYSKLSEGDEDFHKIGGASNKKEDIVELILELYKYDEKIGEKRILIAEATGKNEYVDILDEWYQVDLKSYGELSKIKFRLESQLEYETGVIPQFICVDHIVIGKYY